MKLIVILLSILAGNIHAYVQTGSSESQLAQNVENGVNKLNVGFAKILLKNLKPEGNFIFSPLNIYAVLALVHLGATGTTKNELSTVLGLPIEKTKLAEAHQYLGKLLKDIEGPIGPYRSRSSEVNIANMIFVQKELKLKPEYTNRTTDYYKNYPLFDFGGSGATETYSKSQSQLVDFAKGGSEATNAINKWISDSTKDRISKLFESDISKNTRILLASALYFSGMWSEKFDSNMTENFNTGVKSVQVPTMSAIHWVPFLDDKNLKLQAISIPFMNNEFSMLIVLPYHSVSLKTFVNSLKPEQLSEIISSLKNIVVNYKIPRFKFRWSQSINHQLAMLGIKQMFKVAELGDMLELANVDVKVSEVNHAAEIEVNEEGARASAATAVRVEPLSVKDDPDPQVSFHADRPFLFSIYHPRTGVILFTGVVQNPLSQNA